MLILSRVGNKKKALRHFLWPSSGYGRSPRGTERTEDERTETNNNQKIAYILTLSGDANAFE